MEFWSGAWPARAMVIGMVHLRALRGSPRFDGDSQAVIVEALRDAEALAGGGIDALMMENYGDTPFYPGRVPAGVVAEMTAVACRIKDRVKKPLGINVLRNDGRSALAVAQAAGAAFIRVNVLCGARVADQGILESIAHDLLRDRKRLGAEQVRVFADVDVKHSAPLGVARSLADEVADTVHRGLADAVIVSGSGTGRATDPEHVRAVKAAAGEVPVYVGSGVTAGTVAQFLPHADGFIVGTAFKHGGVASEPVEVERVRAFLRLLTSPY